MRTRGAVNARTGPAEGDAVRRARRTIDVMNVFHPVTRAAARASEPIGRLIARLFPLWAIVHYRGRRTGRELSTPVQVRTTASEFLIALAVGLPHAVGPQRPGRRRLHR